MSHLRAYRRLRVALHYKETYAAGFQQSVLEPETAVLAINSRTTIRDKGENADRERLVFKKHDGFQRTGLDAEEHSGVVELVLVQATEVWFSGFTFAQKKPYIPPSFGDFGGFAMRGGGDLMFGGGSKDMMRGGLSAGETRYGAPETVKVSVGGVRDLRPVAAFRFALAGASEVEV